jgi:hypothetical protein
MNPSGNYTIKVSRSVRDGPIEILLFKNDKSIQPIQINYDELKEHNFRTDSTHNTYLITDVDNSNLRTFLRIYTDSMSNDNNFDEILHRPKRKMRQKNVKLFYPVM